MHYRIEIDDTGGYVIKSWDGVSHYGPASLACGQEYWCTRKIYRGGWVSKFLWEAKLWLFFIKRYDKKRRLIDSKSGMIVHEEKVAND